MYVCMYVCMYPCFLFLGDLRAINNNILDMYQLKSLHAYTHFDLSGLRKSENGEINVDFRSPGLHWDPPVIVNATQPYDKVICCTGFSYVDTDIFSDTCKPGRLHQLRLRLTYLLYKNSPLANVIF